MAQAKTLGFPFADRRVIAGLGALLINAALFSLLVFTPRTPPPAVLIAALNVVLVSPFDRAPPEHAETPAPAETPETPAPEPAAPQARVETNTTQAPSAATPQPRDPETFPVLPGGTRTALRALYCLSSSEAVREVGACPDGPVPEGLALAQYGPSISPEALARMGVGLTAEQIRALLGDVPHKYAGRPTLEERQSPTHTSAGEMREQLPPSTPDPAFGD